jgi:hypothetical protein
VGVEKRNDSEPSDDASKGLTAVKTASATISREKLGE